MTDRTPAIDSFPLPLPHLMAWRQLFALSSGLLGTLPRELLAIVADNLLEPWDTRRWIMYQWPNERNAEVLSQCDPPMVNPRRTPGISGCVRLDVIHLMYGPEVGVLDRTAPSGYMHGIRLWDFLRANPHIPPAALARSCITPDCVRGQLEVRSMASLELYWHLALRTFASNPAPVRCRCSDCSGDPTAPSVCPVCRVCGLPVWYFDCPVRDYPLRRRHRTDSSGNPQTTGLVCRFCWVEDRLF